MMMRIKEYAKKRAHLDFHLQSKFSSNSTGLYFSWEFGFIVVIFTYKNKHYFINYKNTSFKNEDGIVICMIVSLL